MKNFFLLTIFLNFTILAQTFIDSTNFSSINSDLKDAQTRINLQTDIQLLENKNEELTKEQGSKKILNIIQLVVYLTITGVLLGMTYLAYQADFYGI